eukprot:TRINITY_DN4265_c2_g1_i1.p2 TRINITY_DN4265_c2_g1~~TRINITY_DN4265_c2_g1_i1.p2  ORF type:complete len:486 (+),score=122.47 TRINITY_DN4265_c2_g1_i1:119-1576(+)
MAKPETHDALHALVSVAGREHAGQDHETADLLQAPGTDDQASAANGGGSGSEGAPVDPEEGEPAQLQSDLLERPSSQSAIMPVLGAPDTAKQDALQRRREQKNIEKPYAAFSIKGWAWHVLKDAGRELSTGEIIELARKRCLCKRETSDSSLSQQLNDDFRRNRNTPFIKVGREKSIYVKWKFNPELGRTTAEPLTNWPDIPDQAAILQTLEAQRQQEAELGFEDTQGEHRKRPHPDDDVGEDGGQPAAKRPRRSSNAPPGASPIRTAPPGGSEGRRRAGGSTAVRVRVSAPDDAEGDADGDGMDTSGDAPVGTHTPGHTDLDLDMLGPLVPAMPSDAGSAAKNVLALDAAIAAAREQIAAVEKLAEKAQERIQQQREAAVARVHGFLKEVTVMRDHQQRKTDNEQQLRLEHFVAEAAKLQAAEAKAVAGALAQQGYDAARFQREIAVGPAAAQAAVAAAIAAAGTTPGLVRALQDWAAGFGAGP